MSATPKIRGIEMPVERCIQFCAQYRETIAEIRGIGKRPEVAEHDIEFIELVGSYLADLHRPAAPMAEQLEGATALTVPEFEGLTLLEVATRLLEQYATAVDIAGRKEGADRESWLDDARHYKAACGFFDWIMGMEAASLPARPEGEAGEAVEAALAFFEVPDPVDEGIDTHGQVLRSEVLRLRALRGQGDGALPDVKCKCGAKINFGSYKHQGQTFYDYKCSNAFCLKTTPTGGFDEMSDARAALSAPEPGSPWKPMASIPDRLATKTARIVAIPKGKTEADAIVTWYEDGLGVWIGEETDYATEELAWYIEIGPAPIAEPSKGGEA